MRSEVLLNIFAAGERRTASPLAENDLFARRTAARSTWGGWPA